MSDERAAHDYSAYQDQPTGASLATLTRMVALMLERAQLIEERKLELKKAEDDYRDVTERMLPEAMRELGIAEFKTEAGLHLVIEKVVEAGISKERAEAAHAWLEDNGYGGMIKNQITADLGKDSDELADELQGILAEKGVKPKMKKDVHWSTLRAFVRQMLEDGEDLPLELFGVFQKQVAKLK